MGIGRPAALAAVAAAALMGTSLPGAAGPRSAGTGAGLELVAEIPFEGGTHMETATIRGREYAFVSEIAGIGKLRVVDITIPTRPRQVAAIPCNGNQGNVQLGHDDKTLLIGIDSPSQGGCMPPGLMGFVTIDVSNPRRPRPLGYAAIARGSHSLAAHPTEPLVYNGDGFPEAPGEMQVWSTADPSKPKLVTTLDTGAHSPHDLAFNRDGSMLASANAVNVHLMDTTDPAAPRIVHTTQCPGCLHTHEARFTPDGKRLVVNDEHPNNVCPGGAVYFYDIAEDASLLLTGAYTVADAGPNANGDAATKCTPHVFDISRDGSKLAASWHEGGIRYLDISQTSGVTVGTRVLAPEGPKELGWYESEGGYAFTAKLHKGPYVYVVDSNLGFQVFEVAPAA